MTEKRVLFGILSVFFGSYLILNSVGGCGTSCKTSLDCPGGQICSVKSGQEVGVCIPRPESKKGIEPTYTVEEKADEKNSNDTLDKPEENSGNIDYGQGDAGGSEAEPEGEPKPKLPSPKPGELIINEIHADPKSGPEGDANGDGVTSSKADEFIEIVNATAKELSLEGVSVKVGGKKVFTFKEGVSLSGYGAVVIFGGGLAGDSAVNSSQPHPKFSGALVYTAGLSLTNGGQTVTLLSPDGAELDKFVYGTAGCAGDKDQSVTRFPDITGKCTLHLKVSKRRFSPGTRVDGSSFDKFPEPVAERAGEGTMPGEALADGGVSDGPVGEGPMGEGTAVDTAAGDKPAPGKAPQPGDLVINEVHSDPDTKAGDANGDGKANYYQDEFVEIVNVSGTSIQMKGLSLLVDGKVKFTFTTPLILPPKGVVLIFGGGMAGDSYADKGVGHPRFSGAFVFRKRLSLSNTGTHTVSVKGAAGEISKFTYGTPNCEGNKDQSLTLNPDLTGQCSLHTKVSPNKKFSPGTKADGSPF